MAKERMLTVLVPIKDSDCESTVYADYATLVASVPVSPDNINKIYKLANGTFMRVMRDKQGYYNYYAVVDREFPYLGKPLEIFDFTYDATRMGPAPTISAQDIMWFAEKDADGKDVTLEDMWTQECHVTFNGENFYLKQIPTSGKDNGDARYSYDLDFVSERVVLEGVYLYDVVQPFITEKPISESATFSFYGDVGELLKRINASLLKSNLATLVRKYVPYDDFPGDVPYLTYEQWNQIGLDPSVLINTGVMSSEELEYFTENIYDEVDANYSLYLSEYIYENTDGDYTMSGYQCSVGKDKYGNDVTSDEKLISFDGNTIYEALQQIHDTFELQYYIEKERNSSGVFTGNTMIYVADCEHDFADRNQADTDYVRDADGIPTTQHPFDYGVDDALLSKEKTNTTDKIITRITGYGSEENIPWYYPNPNPDGWLKAVYKRDDGSVVSSGVSYPTSEGSTTQSSVLYEKFLKNRIGDQFVFGRSEFSLSNKEYDTSSTITTQTATIIYYFTIQNGETTEANNRTDVKVRCTYDSTKIASRLYFLYKKSGGSYVSVEQFSDNVLESISLGEGEYKLQLEVNFTSGGAPAVETITPLYYYPRKSVSIDRSAWQTFIDTPDHCDIPAFISTRNDIEIYNGGTRDTVYLKYKNGGKLTQTQISNEIMFLTTYNSSQWQSDAYRYVKHSRSASAYNDYIKNWRGYMYNGAALPYDIRDYFSLKDINTMMFYDVSERIENVMVSANSFVTKYIDIYFEMFHDRWFKSNKQVTPSDYGLQVLATVNYGDTITFQRIKYVTPQPTLMPEVYIRTDGERRFYNAHNYYNDGLATGTPDTAIGEEDYGGKIINPLYKREESDPNNQHYVFENEYIPNIPKEHIEKFDDEKPSIKGQTNYVSTNVTSTQFAEDPTRYYTRNDVTGAYEQCDSSSTYSSSTTYYIKVRIDVVEMFDYDDLDNDEIWEDNSNNTAGGEYKHPYLFAKLRPLGFNIFDLALQDDMVISMTTGNCGACNFRIGVDESTKKNPVQIWEYDVYRKTGTSTYTKVYTKGSLRRYVDTENLYYDIDGVKRDVHERTENTVGFLVPNRYSYNQYEDYDFDSTDVADGLVGSLKHKSKIVFEGDVCVRGRFIDKQQDTSVNYVWVALFKDTDTYGTIMPSARPDYGDSVYSVYIDPKGCTYKDRKNGTVEEFTEDEADKFVITNIRLPQVYLRRAEHELSRKIVAYMYDHNYQMFNFSINMSRIFLAQNKDIDKNLNENSVLYVSFNNKTYRQYVKHYTYRMSHEDVLPEINVDMNEELSVSRTLREREEVQQQEQNRLNNRQFQKMLKITSERITRQTVGKFEEVVVRGNIVSQDAKASLVDFGTSTKLNGMNVMNMQENIESNHFIRNDFSIDNGTDLKIGEDLRLPTAYKKNQRIMRRRWDSVGNQFVEDESESFAPAFIDTVSNVQELAEYGYIHVGGSSAPTFAQNTYYKLESGVYVLLTEQPSDWSSNWNAYYKEGKNQRVIPAQKTKFDSFVGAVNLFNTDVAAIFVQIRSTVEERLMPLVKYDVIENCNGFDVTLFDEGEDNYFWYSTTGEKQPYDGCPEKPTNGMIEIEWNGFNP